MAVETPPIAAPPGLSFGASLWSLPARAITVFSGTVGLAIKILLLAILNALAVWAAVRLATDGNWIAIAFLAVGTVGIDAVYASRRAVPLKFLPISTVSPLAAMYVPIVVDSNPGVPFAFLPST